MKIFYKLTDADGYTRRGQGGQTLWGEGVIHTVKGKKQELCSDGLIHFYESPEIAIFMDPFHGNYGNDALLWECAVSGRVWRDGCLKAGAIKCTTVSRIEKPTITIEQRIEIAIKIALKVYHEQPFADWAHNWLSGQDRSASAARAAAWAAAWAAAEAAAWAAAWAAAEAAARAAAAAAAAAVWAADINLHHMICGVIYKGEV